MAASASRDRLTWPMEEGRLSLGVRELEGGPEGDDAVDTQHAAFVSIEKSMRAPARVPGNITATTVPQCSMHVGDATREALSLR